MLLAEDIDDVADLVLDLIDLAPQVRIVPTQTCGRQHQDRELTDDEMAADDETTYWLLDRGWSNDEATFCGDKH